MLGNKIKEMIEANRDSLIQEPLKVAKFRLFGLDGVETAMLTGCIYNFAFELERHDDHHFKLSCKQGSFSDEQLVSYGIINAYDEPELLRQMRNLMHRVTDLQFNDCVGV